MGARGIEWFQFEALNVRDVSAELALIDTTTGTRKRFRRLLNRVCEECFWFGRVAKRKFVFGAKVSGRTK
jgi:hypothetical protein